MPEWMIEAVGVGKDYGALTALAGVDLAVPAGSVLGLLGHNGAGKSTLVNILTTLVQPSRGSARVGGFDVVHQGSKVRARIGVAGQFATVDEQLCGRDNLVLLARLLGAQARAARVRADELLELFDLTAAARRLVRTYSGGLRRRLDLAASLVGHPEVLFLDEPTTGLDPASRRTMWQTVHDLVRAGTTVLLTTQHLDEADRLADWILLLTAGRVVASAPPAVLKAQVGNRTVTAKLANPADLPTAVQALRRCGLHPVGDPARATVTVPVPASRDIARVVRAFDNAAVEADELMSAEPDLDEVYLTLTSRAGRSPAARKPKAER